MIVEFEDSSEEEPESEEIREEEELVVKANTVPDEMSNRSLIPSKNPLLLDFDDSDEDL